MKLALKFGIVALIALVLTVVPGGGQTLDVFLTLLTVAFFAAIGLFGFRLYREHRFTLDALTDRQRLVLYGSIGLAFLTFTATRLLFSQGFPGLLGWLALLGLCSYGGYWVLVRSRRME
jgi:uncharacterized protein involved in cysteine biosynthesis